MLYYCYERAMTGVWSPVCYHGEKPKNEKISDGDSPSRTVLYEVPEDCVDEFGNPMFGMLMKRWPAPGGEE